MHVLSSVLLHASPRWLMAIRAGVRIERSGVEKKGREVEKECLEVEKNSSRFKRNSRGVGKKGFWGVEKKRF
jgi:hypothetical protein